MKMLLLSALLLFLPRSAAAMEPRLEQQFKIRQAVQYWGLGSGVVGSAVAVPMTKKTRDTIADLRSSSNSIEACLNAGLLVFIAPPMIAATSIAWIGAFSGTAAGLGGALSARSTLREAGGSVSLVPGVVGVGALAASPALLLIGMDAEDDSMILAGIISFASANALLLTQSLLNGAEYREITNTTRSLVVPPITFSGRF
ncbi:MAG: hypothetical protein P8R54_29255 [Myxococcota bacterium]|nr:hypothetical protein [Myxococcota bacterium]